jgi:hypothetical protein
MKQVLDDKPGCPSCDGTEYVSFSWAAAVEGAGGAVGGAAQRIGRYPQHLQRESGLKFGSLYACPTCGEKWYLDRLEEWMSVIPRDRLPLLQEWNGRDLILPAELLAVAQEIGATPPDIYGNGSEYVQVPCDVTTKAGERITMALLSFQGSPPIEQSSHTIRFADEIASLRPSEFALTREVRLATSQATEQLNGFAPTHVKAPDGRFFVLNWTVDLFFEGGVKGSDLVIAHERIHEWPPIVSSKKVTTFFADRFPGVERLRLGTGHGLDSGAERPPQRPPIRWLAVKRLQPGKPVDW